VQRQVACALADEALALDERLTLKEALLFWARLDGASPDAGMSAMGLGGIAQVPVRMLSTGQRKRAVLARAIASGAPLWLLDEASNGLDAEGQERLASAMAGHRDRGGAVLAASHHPIGLAGAAEIALVAA
jgi:heme exporter protein A